MKVNVLLIFVTFLLSSLGFQALSCEQTPSPEASPPVSSTPPPNVEPEETLQPIAAVPLPQLTQAEIETLQANLTQGIATWFGLAGLSKMPAPPPLSDALQNYREVWSAVDADAAAFLGSWHDGEGYPYSVNVFPSRTPGQVCVLEFKPEWSLDIFNEVTGEYGKDVISEQILTFSIATVQDGQLRSSQVRSVASATAVARFGGVEVYPVLFMSLMDAQSTPRVVALASPPTLPADLPAATMPSVSQTLVDYGCMTDRVPPGDAQGRD